MSQDTDDTTPYRAPHVSGAFQPTTNALGNITANGRTLDGPPSSRAELDHAFKDGPRPTLWDAVHYPGDSQLDQFETHWQRYRRQGFARGLIDKPVNDTWQETPGIVDAAAEADEDTAFETDVARFLRGETLRKPPVHRFTAADKLGTLGEFAVIVLGFSDGRDLATPVQGADVDPTDDDPWGEQDGEFDGLSDLAYIAVFGQDSVMDYDVETDMSDPRFRLPEQYEIATDRDEDGHPDDTQTVHWTRVVHVAQDTLESDLLGTPFLTPIFHNLVNLDKIQAASAEGYWRGGYQGLVVTPPRGPDGELMTFADDDSQQGGGLSEEINEYERNMRRLITTTGNVESLGTQVADPAPHVETQVREMMAARDIPQSVFMGNETGERATTEDSSMWKEHVSGRRNHYAEPVILAPLIDRLIAVGVLPVPSGDGYEVEWPPLDELTEMEEANVANTLAQALTRLTGSAPDRIATRAELRDVLGWDTTLGAEVDGESMQPGDEEELDDPDADELRVDDTDDAVQDQFGGDAPDGGSVPDESTAPDEGDPTADDADAEDAGVAD